VGPCRVNTSVDDSPFIDRRILARIHRPAGTRRLPMGVVLQRRRGVQADAALRLHQREAAPEARQHAARDAADLDAPVQGARQESNGKWKWIEMCYCTDASRSKDSSPPFANIVRCQGD
jgi:hypothetical protein